MKVSLNFLKDDSDFSTSWLYLPYIVLSIIIIIIVICAQQEAVHMTESDMHSKMLSMWLLLSYSFDMRVYIFLVLIKLSDMYF